MILGFVHIPKTGGSTLKAIFRKSFGVRHCDVKTLDPSGVFTAHEFQRARLVYPLLRSLSGHSLVDPGAHLEGVRYCTVLRDPVQRVASGYQHHHRGGLRKRRGEPLLPLAEYVNGRRVANRQTRQIAGSVDLERAKSEIRSRYFAVMLLEKFDESLATLARLSPLPIDTRYTRKNVAPSNDVKAEILGDPSQRGLIEEANQIDQALYDWVVDELYPEQLERARRCGPLPAVGGPGGEAWAFASRIYNNVFYRTLLMKARSRLSPGRRSPVRPLP